MGGKNDQDVPETAFVNDLVSPVDHERCAIGG
jgi:hypothetical protein